MYNRVLDFDSDKKQEHVNNSKYKFIQEQRARENINKNNPGKISEDKRRKTRKYDFKNYRACSNTYYTKIKSTPREAVENQTEITAI